MTTPNFGSGNTARSVIAVEDTEKKKIDTDAKIMRREFLLQPTALAEQDARYILYFKELFENKFVVIDKNRICIEYPYPAEPTIIPDMFEP
eukprot:gene32928-41997_t